MTMFKFICGCLTLIGTTWSYASELNIVPYVGVDAQVRQNAFVRDYGDGLFRKNAYQGNFFFGTKKICPKQLTVIKTQSN